MKIKILYLPHFWVAVVDINCDLDERVGDLSESDPGVVVVLCHPVSQGGAMAERFSGSGGW